MAGMPIRPARIALVGDRSPHVQAHARIGGVLRHSAASPDAVDPYWIATPDVADVPALGAFDGIWLVPGSPYADRAGALRAVTEARAQGIPFLGTCAGFQHALLEFARSVCGIDAGSAEQDDDSRDLLLVPLSCSLLGEEASVDVRPGTLAAQHLGAGPRTERFFCRYGLDEQYRARLEAAGLVFSGADTTGAVRLLELPGHPFFLGSLFQPELSSDETWVHPLIRAFVAAALDRAGRAARAGAGASGAGGGGAHG